MLVVPDGVAPVFERCPENIVAIADPGTSRANVTWEEPHAVDNLDYLLEVRWDRWTRKTETETKQRDRK